jgi:cellulose synthase/poly-beta-1,6-N-acetylglucosamine synthase-like glycosyltransferase
VRALVAFDYPPDRFEVIVVNDRSTDDTGAILDRLAQQFPVLRPLHVPLTERSRGKSSALNRGLTVARGEYIAVYDADNTPERPALRRLVAALAAQPSWAAVVGKFRVINAHQNVLTRFINIETISFQWMVQGGRWYLFRLATIPGTNFVIRRAVLDEMGGWDEGALAEDTEISIRIYETGRAIGFLPTAVTWEQEPETWRVWLKQRTRWVQGNTYVILKFVHKLLTIHQKRSHLDILYFFVTYFGFLGGVMLSDLLFILSLLGWVHLSLLGPFTVVWILAYVLFVVEIVVTLEIEATELTWVNFLTVLLMYFTYSQVWLYLVVRGIGLQLRTQVRHEAVVWQKTERF